MDEIMLSFIVPAYNCEKYIETCVNSILRVNVPFECIIVNDGSEDNTYKICKKLEKNCSKIKVINVANSGVSNARNIGIDNARGKYITFVDADDYIVENNFDFIKGADLYCLNISKLNKNKIEGINFKNSGLVNNFIKFPLYMNSVCNKIFKREVVEKNKIRFNREYYASEDQFFVIKFIDKADEIKYIDEMYYIYRTTENSATTKKRNVEIILNNYFARIESIKICKSSLKEINDKKLISFLRLEAAIQFLIFEETYNPLKYRELIEDNDIWKFNYRIDFFILTLTAKYKIDCVSKFYIKIKKIINNWRK